MLKSMFPMRRQRGLTLIESLVALVIAALGVLGIAGVQMRTLTNTQNSVHREQAIRLIEDLDERLKVHPNSLAQYGSYVSGWNATPAAADCKNSACDAAALAAYDLTNWKALVRRTLPLGDANVFLAPGDNDNNHRLLGVMVRWRQNESSANKDYVDVIDATQPTAADGGTGTDSKAIKCNDSTDPDKYTCHLQYITLSARCAPYFPGGDPGATAQYYCPGP
jgi:type IV pilus assembly protein PilV